MWSNAARSPRPPGALSLSQPAVSQSLKQLETALGVVLVKRTSHGITPTAEGRELFSYVEKGYEQFEAGEKRILQMCNLERGEITIGASDMTLRFFLLPYLERFHEKNPGIKVSVTNGPTPATMDLLREGKIDFGVVSGPILPEDGIGHASCEGNRRYFRYREKFFPSMQERRIP